MIPFDTALRATEIITALCFLQQGAEHMRGFRDERRIHMVRMVAAFVLLTGWATPGALVVLAGCGLALLHRFQGPYNGGSDKMSLLILACLCGAHWAPTPHLAEVAYAYLAFQLTLSYFISGWVKLRNPEWRSGRALVDVFAWSAYPVSEGLRIWAQRPRALWLMSWGVIGFEVLFPLALLDPRTTIFALMVAGSFHFSNACFFGLNRFFWIWLAAYPSLLWFQGRLPV